METGLAMLASGHPPHVKWNKTQPYHRAGLGSSLTLLRCLIREGVTKRRVTVERRKPPPTRSSSRKRLHFEISTALSRRAAWLSGRARVSSGILICRSNVALAGTGVHGRLSGRTQVLWQDFQAETRALRGLCPSLILPESTGPLALHGHNTTSHAQCSAEP